jgi:carboxynorspermidine decarboxylase
MMDDQPNFWTEQVCSPAFIIDQRTLMKRCGELRSVHATKLYSTKALALPCVFDSVRGELDGFSVSSPFEALLAAEMSEPQAPIHFTSPGLSYRTIPVIARTCTHVSLNSISQWNRLTPELAEAVSLGLRVNACISTVRDLRYDPCRPNSKLGILLQELAALWHSGVPKLIDGIHVHNACLSRSWLPILKTARKIESVLETNLNKLKWVNLGGGYIWDETTDFGPVQEAVDMLTTTYGLEVFVEPGAGIVNSAGYLVASVVDVFKSEGKTIAVLDTTVNHLPEVFEYQFEPDVMEHTDEGYYEYILAGCSCLAGDLFGEYCFMQPLEIGSRVTFENVGAYTMVKANMFNGINLPSIYALDQTGQLELIKEFAFEDFANRCGFSSHEYANI